MSAAWRWRVFAPLAEQALVGSATALVASLAELVVILIRAEERSGAFAAFASILGMSLPLGWIAGAALGVVVAIVRETPWLTELRRAWGALFRRQRDPRAFATLLSLATAVASLVVISHIVASYFRAHFHSETLIGLAIALTLPIVAAFAVLLAALVHHAARAAAPFAGVLASGPGALLILGGGAVSLGFKLAPRVGQMAGGIHPLPYLWPFGILVAYPLMGVVVRRWVKRPVRAGLVVFPLAVLAVSLTAWSYGSSQSTRRLVEQESVEGRRLVRLYASWTDWDGDGHASTFGGGDCDDGDPYVHPGAIDEPGDGVDADCFDGDGTAGLEGVLGNGHYGRPVGRARRAPILLITIDALRPDHLGFNDYVRQTSPRIDGFAADAVVFDEALAPSSRSVRSIPSMMTGHYASQIAYGPQHLYPAIRPENEMLAEVLKRHGYATRACMGSDYFSRVDGFFQGFDDVAQPPHSPRNFPVDCALEHLAEFENQPQQPFLLWVHLYNVHDPYLPDAIPSRYGPRYLDMYDEEIHLADREVGRLLDAVAASPESERWVVVMASDHGEAFGEHGNRGHSTTLYQEEVRSVLMMRVPGVEPRHVPDVVSLMDVAPTLRNLVAIPGRPEISGRSLVPFLTESEVEGWAERPVFMELLPDGRYPFDQKSVRIGDWKLTWWVREGTLRLSNLAEDPTEERDWLEDDPARAERLHGLLRAWMATHLATNRSGDVVREHLLTTVPRIQHRLDLRYPGFTVLGYDMPATRVAQGTTIPLTFYYRADRRVDVDGYFTLDLFQAGGRRYPDFHGHHYPVYGSHHTDAWEPGQIIRDPVEIVVPRDVPVGDWNIQLSVRENDFAGRWLQFQRDGQPQNQTLLGTVNIVSSRRPAPPDAGATSDATTDD